LGTKRNQALGWNAGFSGYRVVKTQFEETKKSEGGESTTLCTSGEPPKQGGGYGYRVLFFTLKRRNKWRFVEYLDLNGRPKKVALMISFLILFILFPVALRPNVGKGLLIFEVSKSHTTTHNNLYDSSRQVISSFQRPLPDNTQHSQ
jgi:hypothetical protein